MQVPPNGLVIYTGTILTDEGKERKVNIDFEPFKPINTSLYLCDNKFHTEALSELLESDSKCAFAFGSSCIEHRKDYMRVMPVSIGDCAEYVPV